MSVIIKASRKYRKRQKETGGEKEGIYKTRETFETFEGEYSNMSK